MNPFESFARVRCLKHSNTYTNNQHVCFLPLFILVLTMTDTLYSKPSEGQQCPHMPELPAEIWSMIVKHVKREPPPAGEPGNWNDHFHQQDLTSLMRVNHVSLFRLLSSIHGSVPFWQHSRLLAIPSGRPAPRGMDIPLRGKGERRVTEKGLIDVQTLYQVVSEVLYHSPVVQDVGLFLQGIEKPIILDTYEPDQSRSALLATTIGSSLGHKRDLLGKVQTLYIIHHSSRTPEGSVFMVTRGKPRDDPKLEDHHADILGSADLAG